MDISFYMKNGTSETIEVSETLYEWLAQSSFSKIDISKPMEIVIDNESHRLEVINLSDSNRMKYTEFLKENIVNESEDLLKNIELPEFVRKYQDKIYRVKKMYELKKMLGNENFYYMEYL